MNLPPLYLHTSYAAPTGPGPGHYTGSLYRIVDKAKEFKLPGTGLLSLLPRGGYFCVQLFVPTQAWMKQM